METEIIDTGSYQMEHGIMYRHHHTEEYEIVFFKNDTRVFINGDNTYHQLKNRVFLTCPGEEHELCFPDGVAEIDSLPLQFQWVTFLISNATLAERLRSSFSQGYIEVSNNFSRYLAELHYKFLSKNELLRISMEHQFLGLLYDLVAAGPAHAEELAKDERIADAITFMYTKLYTELDLSELAQKLDLNRNYLFLFFKQHTKLTPMQFFTDLKLNEAARVLLNTDWKLNKISTSLKFYDVSHFSRLFRKKFGTSPLRFRQDNIPLHLLKRVGSDV